MRDSSQHLRQGGTFGSIRELPDAPCPIKPDWMRSGTPVTRCNTHSSTVDGLAWTMVWDCTRSTFEWYFEFDEVVVILEGSVRVTDCRGVRHTLRAGDVGYFPYGSTWLWEVDDYVRKVAFCRHEVPRGLRLVTRIVRRLGREWRDSGSPLAIVRRLVTEGWRRAAGIGRITATLMLIGIPL